MERVEATYDTTTDAMRGLRDLIKEKTVPDHDEYGRHILAKPEVVIRLFPDYGWESGDVALPLTSIKAIMEQMERVCTDDREVRWRTNRRCVFTLWYWDESYTNRIHIRMEDKFDDHRATNEDGTLKKDENGDIIILEH
jgi:hypothetical protein